MAIGVVMLMAAEPALVAQSSGLAFAAPAASSASRTSSTARASGPAQARDEASAVLMARLQHRKIEVLSARTTDSTTYALPSGELQSEVYAGPVRVKQDGGWKDVNTSLSDTGSDLTPAAANADIAVSDGGDRQLASVVKGKKSFGLGWEDELPAPSVKGSTASYDLGSGQVLSVTALAQGFSENIKLARRPGHGAVSYRIPLHLSGLKLSQARSGHLLLKSGDGALVAEAPAPMMWDASKDAASGESAHRARVGTRIETASDGSQTLVLSPDKHFLATATYPVTVDPTSTLAVTTDTWVQTPDYLDSQVSSAELKSGTYDSGTDVARSYLKFDVSPFKGKHITDTNLALYSYYSSTCATTGAGTEVRQVTANWDQSTLTWGAQPATTTTGAVVNKAALGYDSSCPAGTMNFDIDTIVQAWANGSANYGLRIAGASEKDSLTWRRFRSANYISGDNSVEPHLTVTYNSYATTSSAAISPSSLNPYSGKRYATSLTPTLSAKVTDADGSTVKGQFEVTADPAYADNTYSYTGTSASVTSGSTAKLTIPSASAFPAGAHLRFRVRGYDGTDYGSWSGYTTFVMNTALPAAPTISCTPYSANTWTAKADSGATCTLDTSSADGMGYYWGLDDSSVPGRVYDTVDGNGGDPLTVTIKPGEDWHTLYAKTVDSGGNVSTATTQYAFGVGADGAALLTPRDGDRPARRVALTATGKSTYTGVTYQYRRGETDSWKNVPLADVVRNSDGSAVTAWPLQAPNGAPPALAWNITTTLAEDGPIDVRAQFTDGTTTGYSQPVTVTVDRQAGDSPKEDVGPGEVNLLTGDFTMTEGDVSAFGLAVTRSISSRRALDDQSAQGQAPIFGPGWISGVTAESNASQWISIRKTSATSVEVVDAQGVGTGFTATSAGGWKAEPGSESLTLTGALTGSFTLKDAGGVTTTFTKVSSAATTWQVATSYRSTSNSVVTVVSEPVTSGGQTLARPKYMIAPTSAVSADTCAVTPSTAGCRVLEFLYSTSTTATSSAFGEYAGAVKQIRLWSTEPNATAATAKTVQWYEYDSTGYLRGTWHHEVSPATLTEYGYDTAGRLTTLTQQSQLPTTFAYGKAGNAATAGDGMLLSVSRPGLQQGTTDVVEGTAATNLVYDVPLTGTTAPYAMSGSDVAAWGQQDVPTDATAVFPADAVPASHDGGTLAATAYTRASISYADASGREVNTASPGGHITTAEYNSLGNTLRSLSATNRELALATTGDGYDTLTRLGISALSTAQRAQELSSTSVYSTDGQREVESFQPLHLTTLTSTLKGGTSGSDLPAGSEVAARVHTVTAYDEGRPTDGSANVSDLPTTVTTGAFVDGYPSDADTSVTKTGYDWAKGLATSTIEDAGGLNLTRTTTYDAQGHVIESRLPKSNGSDAGTTVTTYYSATGTGACQGRPEWADLVCSTGPAGAITGGGSNPSQLPTKTVQYDWWGQPVLESETANGVTRTHTIVTDSLGRVTRTSTTGGVGPAVPDVTYTYDPDTGQQVTQSSNGQTITTAYDKLGREISYNDGAGNTTVTQYDLLDRPVKVTDSAPGTTTYTYDSAKDPRGLPTSMTDSVAGTFTAAYDAEGDITAETLPGGYSLAVQADNVGQVTSATYTRDSDGAVVLSDTAAYSVDGRIVEHNATAGDTTQQSYSYDKTGRLVGTDDTAADGSCTRRGYTFDKNTNRTALTTSVGDPGVGCTDSGATTTGYTYDSADRLIATGVTYDAFGRTTSQPGTTIDYFNSDRVHSQTTDTTRQTWDLDAAARLGAWSDETKNTDGSWTQTARKTNHYGSTDDNPSWIAEDTNGPVTRNVRGISGSLEATTSATGDVVLQLVNIHGDVGVQLPLDAGKSPVVLRVDEYGNAQADTPATRYGWLGSEQRSAETPTGAILMGARLYDPRSGRFLSVDPVAGGNANAYDYATADPVNKEDTNGQWHYWRTRYFSWGRSVTHVWNFWKSCFCRSAGLHTGASLWLKFNRTGTRLIAGYSHYFYGFISAALAFVPEFGWALSLLVLGYGAWTQAIAQSQYNRGKCVGFYVTYRLRYGWWVGWAYPYRRNCG
ncbi:DNRLRE domain-containing protein [Streptomyces anandii]|uniref:DNRLRE domain-containing protein n=1 Tax=Streptomyces anandii TaxID=285454 RepID=A0ABW6H5H8_9ACTN